MSERIQKCFARMGLGSRRAVEEWIKEGRVKINGKTAQLGDRMELTDRILLDGVAVHMSRDKQKTRVIIYNKPEGEICTVSDPEGRKSVFESLPPLDSGRWIGVGRLDFNTSGLLLFTNDGDLAHQLMHPSGHMPREYAARISGQVTPSMVKNLTHGVELEDGRARFEDLVESGGSGTNSWFHVVVMQGRNRIVRRLWESQGVRVSRLQRVRFGPIFLERSLRQGRCKDLTEGEINRLKNESSPNEKEKDKDKD